jgi:hypothetical protein
MSEGNGQRLDDALNSKLALIITRVIGPTLLGVLVMLMIWQVNTLARLDVAVARLEIGAAGIDRRLTMIETRRDR